jgi:hypothetical protein
MLIFHPDFNLRLIKLCMINAMYDGLDFRLLACKEIMIVNDCYTLDILRNESIDDIPVIPDI